MITSENAQGYHCPRWQELPNIPLYMDQVIMIMQEALALFAEGDEPAITPAMINNYVKQKFIDPPHKKKYEKTHIAQLIVLSLLKKVFSMAEILSLIQRTTEEFGMDKAYDAFCDTLEHYLRCAFGEPARPLEQKIGQNAVQSLLEDAMMALICKLLVQNRLVKAE